MPDVCTRAPPAPSSPSSWAMGPDLLRKERFGALYYHRAKATFDAVPPGLAKLLLAATRESALDAYARTPAVYGLEERALAEAVVRMQRDGMLDERFRCHARVVEAERSHGALIGPLVTHLQLTIACNLRCSHCYADIMAKPAPDELTTDEVLSLFAELDALGSPVVVLAGGEPMLRRDLPEILAGLERHTIDAWLCTNATLVNEDNARLLARSTLRGVSVSLDGPDAATHEHLRGRGRFAHALRGIRLLVEVGAREVQLRVTVTPHNADRLLDFAPLAAELGVQQVVMKPFRQSGAASGAEPLLISRSAYLEAAAAVRARWPEDGVPLDVGDGMPQRPPSWTRIMPAFACVGGTTSVSILHDGRIMGCGSVTSSDDWRYRDVGFARAWREAPGVVLWRTLGGNDQCRSCGNFSRCGGGCRARAVGAGLTIDESDPWAYCSEGEPRPVSPRRLPVVA